MRLAASYSEKLLKSLSEQFSNDSQEQKHLDFIHQNTARAHEMVLHLLDYAHIQDGVDEVEDVDLNKILRITKDIMKYKFHNKKVKINVQDLPKIQANREQMLQLFRSLIDNAVKFQQDGQVARIDIAVNEDDERYHIDISDNGIGIPPDKCDVVFDIFKRLHKREDYEGAGVGLTMAKRIVGNHGGAISAESNGTKGTKISFTLAKDLETLKANERQYGYKQLC